jgi:hypothetical protein
VRTRLATTWLLLALCSYLYTALVGGLPHEHQHRHAAGGDRPVLLYSAPATHAVLLPMGYAHGDEDDCAVCRGYLAFAACAALSIPLPPAVATCSAMPVELEPRTLSAATSPTSTRAPPASLS